VGEPSAGDTVCVRGVICTKCKYVVYLCKRVNEIEICSKFECAWTAPEQKVKARVIDRGMHDYSISQICNIT